MHAVELRHLPRQLKRSTGFAMGDTITLQLNEASRERFSQRDLAVHALQHLLGQLSG